MRATDNYWFGHDIAARLRKNDVARSFAEAKQAAVQWYNSRGITRRNTIIHVVSRRGITYTYDGERWIRDR